MCPDTAILGKVISEETLQEGLTGLDKNDAEEMEKLWPKVRKYWDNREKKGQKPGRFGIFIDPSKCKGCAECVDVCGSKDALAMIPKEKMGLDEHRPLWDFSRVLVCMPAFGSRMRVWRCQLWGMQTLSRHCVRGVYWALLRCVDSWFPPSFHCPCCASPGVRRSPGVVSGLRARAAHLGQGVDFTFLPC